MKWLKPVVIVSSLAIATTVLFNVLDTFFFAHSSGAVASTDSSLFTFDEDEDTGSTSSGGLLGGSSSSSSTTYISSLIEEEYDEVPYVLAEINLAKISHLRTAMATNSSGQVGSNITKSFSNLISEGGDNVLLAIDGDFAFWKSRKGYVVRNGQTLRSNNRTDSGDDLAIFKDGSHLVYDESDYSFDTINEMNNGCYHNWCFGPALLVNGEINVTTTQDVSQSMSANQRVAMGIDANNHFFFLGGGLSGSSRRNGEGLSLYEMASILKDAGCTTAYNFDGGGSAGFYYNLDGKSNYFLTPSRSIGDIVYVVAE